MSKRFSKLLPAAALAAMLATPAAHAGGFLTEFLFNAGSSAVRGLFGAAKDGIVNAVSTKESPQDKAARERAEISRAVEQAVAQLPEDQHEAARARMTERLNLIQQQYSAIEARQAAQRDERNSVGGILGNAVLDGATSTVGNRAALSAAGVAAQHRVGAMPSTSAMDAAAAQAKVTTGAASSGGFDFAKVQAMTVGAAVAAQATRPAHENPQHAVAPAPPAISSEAAPAGAETSMKPSPEIITGHESE